jgi:xylulokinase
METPVELIIGHVALPIGDLFRKGDRPNSLLAAPGLSTDNLPLSRESCYNVAVTQPTTILAHDLGTTGDKATLFDAATGAALAATFEAYPTAYPHPNWVEQDPAHWQAAVFAGTRRLLERAGVAPAAVAAVSFSGTMQGALPVDAAGQPLRPSIIWADQRATVQSDAICAACGADAIYRLTGLRASPSYTAAKMLWVREHQPEIFRRTHKVLQVKDYAAFLLTGVLATDYSDASGTQLFDIRARRWVEDMATAIGLPAVILPDLYPSATVIGGVTPTAAAATGLLAGTPVVLGGGDGACATVGSGAVAERDAYTYIGASAWLALSAAEPLLDPGQRTITMAHLHPRLYFTLGNMQSAGGAYDWLAGLLAAAGEAKDFRALDALAAGAPPGAGGLLFLPHLLGERAPYWNPAARGAFVGLAMPHGRAEMARATLEGVALHLRLILDTLREQGAAVQAMRLIGGGAQSALWRQILADALGLPILLPGLTAEATSLGAAIAGGVGVGLYPDFGIASQLIPVYEAEQLDPTTAARYDELVGLYAETYRALEPIFRRLNKMNQEPHCTIIR